MTAANSEDLPTLGDLGWDEEFSADFQVCASGQGRPARVSRVDRGLCTVLTPREARISYGSHPVTTGDWVVFAPAAEGQERAQVTGILPRRTAFKRLGAGAEPRVQVVAANVDVVLLAQAVDRDLNLHSLQRYLALGWDSGAIPVVVLTKADCRAPDELGDLLSKAGEVALGAELVAVSAASGQGMEEMVERWLKPSRTVAVVGASGAGKSTIVNWIVGAQRMATGAVRADGKGRHTTSHRQLIPLPGRGVLLDTPGLRSLGMWADNEGLARAFAELDDLAEGCRFRDCGHEAEPGCAVQEALRAGMLSKDRLESWRKLERELRSLAGRQGHPAIQRQEKQRWRNLTRQQRSNVRH